eukprot:11169115-Lingulodinium_polyedra.AAC.1
MVVISEKLMGAGRARAQMQNATEEAKRITEEEASAAIDSGVVGGIMRKRVADQHTSSKCEI